MGSAASATELADTDLAFEINALNEMIDLEQGKAAIAQMNGIELNNEHSQLPLCPLVEKGEERAMRICDLKKVVQLIVSRCEKEKWVSTYDGRPLKPDMVNLYDLNHYVILPSTVPRGVLLIGLNAGTYEVGQSVHQEIAGEWAKFQQAEGVVLEATSETSILIRVTRGRFVSGRKVFVAGTEAGSPVFVQFKDGVRLSAKEMLHPEPTKPDWFISHWWGDSVISFVRRCEKHAMSYHTQWTEDGELFDEEKCSNYAYWICAYANNQHELATEIVQSPMQSPFMNALTSSSGALLMLDKNGMPFSRIWCDFEIFMTLMDGKTLDIISVDKKGRPVLLSENLLPCDEDAEDKSHRDKSFPPALLAKGMSTTLERGDASQQVDKVRILKAMTSMKSIVLEKDVVINWDDAGPLDRIQEACPSSQEEQAYDLANRTLNGRFAVSAWPRAHAEGCVTAYHTLLNDSDGKELNLPAITSHAPLLQTYEITLMGDVTDESFQQVCEGIPLNALNVRIEQHDMEGLTDNAFFSLWEKLAQMPNVQHVDIKMGNLSNTHSDAMITDSSRGLATILPRLKSLKVLVLDIEGDTYQYDSCLSNDAVAALAAAINMMVVANESALEVVKIDFGGWDEEMRVYQMHTAEEVAAWSATPLDTTFATPRIDHGFGNSLSKSSVHRQRSEGRVHKNERSQKRQLFAPLIHFFSKGLW